MERLFDINNNNDNNKIKKYHKKIKKNKSFDFESSKFRLLNEILYTNSSKYTLDYFNSNKHEFSIVV